MCGQYLIEIDESELRDIVDAVEKKTQEPEPDQMQIDLGFSGVIRPTDRAPVLLSKRGALIATVMKWGYPGYPDRRFPSRKPAPLFNAKSETAVTLNTWRNDLATRRCIVPSSGFFEWQHGGADKTKYLFRLPGENVLYMAGIYKAFLGPDGVVRPHFSILTTAANKSMCDVHSRMPVVLRKGEFDEWLYGDYMSKFKREDLYLERSAA